MGKQVNFYFDRPDEARFLSQRGLSKVEFLVSDVDSPEVKLSDVFREELDTSSSSSQVYICLRSYFSSVVYQRVEERGYSYLDPFASPVIEYTRSGLNTVRNVLIAGRIWYEHKYWDKDDDGNDVLVEKPERLLRLFNSLARWIREYCTRLPNGMYIGPHAMELHKKGAKLSP
jgi:hypothetical protein